MPSRPRAFVWTLPSFAWNFLPRSVALPPTPALHSVNYDERNRMHITSVQTSLLQTFTPTRLGGVMLFILLLAQSLSLAQQSVDDRRKLKLDAGAPTANVSDASAMILEQTNAFRKEHDLPPLASNQALEKAAVDFAKFMARTHEYGHQADKREPWHRAEAAGYKYCAVLENIAFQYQSNGLDTQPMADAFMQGWKDSPGHRANMLSPTPVEIGIGVAMADNGVYYAVQKFGRPQSMMFDVRFENRSTRDLSYTFGDKTFTLRPRVIRTHSACGPSTLSFDLPQGSPAPDNAALLADATATYVLTNAGQGVKVTVEKPAPKPARKAK